MAITLAQLTSYFTNANAGTAPTATQTAALQGIFNQNATAVLNDAAALQAAIDLGSDTTTAISVQTYQYFLGFAPSEAGLAALNAAYVGSGAQAAINGENRYIAQSVSLAMQNADAKAAFSAKVGAMSYADAATLMYNEIVGSTAAAAAGINVANAVSFLTSASAIAYYTAFVKANAGLGANPSAADIDLAVKAALVGAILNAATTFNNGAGVGSYATAANNLMKDLADDGHLTANNAAGINLFTKYATPVTPQALKLTTGIDTLTGGDGADTITGLFAEGTNSAVDTLTTFDTIDGGAGVDTLNLYLNGKNNNSLPTNATIKNVEVVNLYADSTPSTTLTNAATYGSALTQLWQIGREQDVTNLAEGQTAGFRNTSDELYVYAKAGATSVSVALDGTDDTDSDLYIGDWGDASNAIKSVTITGSTADTYDDGANQTYLYVGLGKNVSTLTLNSSVDLYVTYDNNWNNTGGTVLRTLDASASTGAIAFDANGDVRTVTTGSGADYVRMFTATVIDNVGTTADETVSASVTTGAGDDAVYIDTTGTGATTVSTGEGDDNIEIGGAGSNTLTVNAGAGDDLVYLMNSTTVSWSSSSTGVKDVVSGGDGVDTLFMSAAVAAANSGVTTFERAIDGFEKVSIGYVSDAENATVDLANLDDISYVVTRGSDTAAGVTEVATVTFYDLRPGQSITIGGATYTNSSGVTMAAADVATAFAAAYDIAGYTESKSGSVITYTSSTANTNVANLTVSSAAGSAPSVATFTVVDGVAPVTGTAEVSTVTFQGLFRGESTTVAGRTVTGTGVTETVQVTFTALAAGQTLTVNGVTVTVAPGGATAADVAGAFAAGATFNNAVVTGSQNAAYSTSISGAVVTYTATTQNANVTDIAITGADAGTASLGTITQGATGNLTASQVAAAFATGTTSGGAVVSGSLSGYTAGAASGQSVTFTSTTLGNVSNIGVTTNSGASLTVSTTDGVNTVAAVTENGVITFGALLDGQSVTVSGRTVMANNGNLTAAQVADAYAAGVGTYGSAVVSGSVTGGWTINNAVGGDAFVEYVSGTTNTNVTNFSGSTSAALATATPGLSIAQGSEAFGNLTLNNLAAGGTVEMTESNAATLTINLADATGAADVVNLKINGSSNIVNPNGGTVVVAGVETINIATADTTALSDPSAASKPNLVAAAATTVTVTGNHGVDFTGSTLTGLTTLDASGVVSTRTTGAAAAAAVTFTAAASTSKTLTITTGMGNDVINLSANTKASTVNTGAGDDTVTGTGGADTINAGDGNDVVNSSAGADTITLGAGKDSYKLGNSAHSLLAVGDTITDFSANTVAQTTASMGANTNIVQRTGDVIDVSGRFGMSVTGIKVGIATNAADAQTQIQNIATNDGTLTGFVLDSSTGKLYMDFNDDGNVDSVVTLTGVTTLTTAAFLTGLGVS